METQIPMREMGGYLPLEGNRQTDYFSALPFEGDVLRTNSGKAAIYHGLLTLEAPTVHMPYYCCSSVFMAAQDAGKRIQHYHLTDTFLPDLAEVEPDPQQDILFLVNYFGALSKTVADYALSQQDRFAAVVVDQSHCFFAAPLMSSRIYNVYSCRKFFGVPDGGYLIASSLPVRELPNYKASDHFQYLVVSLEEGQNAAYKDSKAANEAVQAEYIGMSEASRQILGLVDYRRVAAARRDNFKRLHEAFQSINRFDLSTVTDPLYIFPLWLERNIKAELVAQKIYVPTLWREALIPACEDRMEYDLTENTAFLPLDQRYGATDMEYLVGIVKDILKK
ncbi:MAG TPA: hypothetical protein GX717_08020 [Clostridiaceae bacterium]|nr:hypothetical protein [Clostridiaceae bacterium]